MPPSVRELNIVFKIVLQASKYQGSWSLLRNARASVLQAGIWLLDFRIVDTSDLDNQGLSLYPEGFIHPVEN